MSWLTQPNKNRGATSCPHSSLMRLAHSTRHHSHTALARRPTGTMLTPVLASMSPPRSLGDLIADAIQESIDVRGACISADHSSPGTSTCLDLPTKLHAILSSAEFEGAVSWMPHGYAWKIKDLNLFASKVLPMFVDGGAYPENYNRFVRMLTSLGFKQVTRGPDTSAYYHEMFLRGIPHLLSFIVPSQHDLSRPRHDIRGEPDFYSFIPLSVDIQPSDFRRFSHGWNPPRATSAGFLQQLLVNRGATAASGSFRRLTSPLPSDPSVLTLPAPTDPVLEEYNASNLCALQHLHQARLEYLGRAQQLAEATSPPSPQLELVTKGKKGSKEKSKSPKVQGSPRTVDNTKIAPKKKRTRRKWLPPLGPPSTAICQPNAASSASEWYLTNPEVFATLSEGSDRTSCPPSKK